MIESADADHATPCWHIFWLYGCRYPHLIMSLNQTNRPVNLSRPSGWRETCSRELIDLDVSDAFLTLCAAAHAQVSINPFGPKKVLICHHLFF